MIDLHCHLLPGIDDGPTSLQESLELCRIAVADGITHAVVTPHIHPGRWGNTRASIQRDCAALQCELDALGIALQLGFAAEVRLTDELMGQIEREEIPYYGEVDGYQVMLLEFPHGHVIPGSEQLVNWLMRQQIRPLIAHPERNRQVMKNPALLQPFIEAGCWLQITGGAVTGHFGERAQAVARQLLEVDQVTAVASDGHNSKARPPALQQAYASIASDYGEGRAQRLMNETPATIAAGQFDSKDDKALSTGTRYTASPGRRPWQKSISGGRGLSPTCPKCGCAGNGAASGCRRLSRCSRATCLSSVTLLWITPPRCVPPAVQWAWCA